jgi:hypothetical protein
MMPFDDLDFVVYNVDRVGFGSWVDATRMSVIVPVDYEDSQIAVRITRSDARTTMVARIAANGRASPAILDRKLPADYLSVLRRNSESRVAGYIFEDDMNFGEPSFTDCSSRTTRY